jgi:hypothetical protein
MHPHYPGWPGQDSLQQARATASCIRGVGRDLSEADRGDRLTASHVVHRRPPF